MRGRPIANRRHSEKAPARRFAKSDHWEKAIVRLKGIWLHSASTTSRSLAIEQSCALFRVMSFGTYVKFDVAKTRLLANSDHSQQANDFLLASADHCRQANQSLFASADNIASMTAFPFASADNCWQANRRQLASLDHFEITNTNVLSSRNNSQMMAG